MNAPIICLTADQAAEYLKVTRRTILAWVHDGKLKGHPLTGTIRRVWRFTYNDLNSMLEAR
jgi:excisionase family DNA binding protein